VERRRRLERCEVPAKPNDLNALQKLLFYLASSRFPHETNIAEAQHRTLFVAGWRPFIGWVSGLALVYTFLIQPLFLWINSIYSFQEKFFGVILHMLVLSHHKSRRGA
jgi:hypothetical protein